MKAKSAKAKGSRFETFVLNYVRENVDAHAYKPIGSGSGLEKGDVYLPNHDVVIEAKNQRQVKLLEWWEQAEEQAHHQMPALILRHPRYSEEKKTLAVIHFEDFCELLKHQYDTVEVDIPDADFETRKALDLISQGYKMLKRKYKI